jgi:hypothetical protein
MRKYFRYNRYEAVVNVRWETAIILLLDNLELISSAGEATNFHAHSQALLEVLDSLLLLVKMMNPIVETSGGSLVQSLKRLAALKVVVNTLMIGFSLRNLTLEFER